MQLVYNLSDPEMEDDFYEAASMRRFSHLRLCESILDETAILNFREGTVVDRNDFRCVTSTKNAERERDPDMHQVKRQLMGYGIKMHIGADEGHGIIHSITTTAANEHDTTQVDKFLHDEEQRVCCDAQFQDVDMREEQKDSRFRLVYCDTSRQAREAGQIMSAGAER